MLSLIKNILTSREEAGPADRGKMRTEMAACVLLLETAHVDGECTDEEMEHVVKTLQQDFSLSSGHAAELIDIAHRRREDAVDLWQFTNLINQQFTKPEKMAVMESVWRVIFADGQLEKHEDYFAHKLANLLRLTHQELIDAKLQARKAM